MAEPTRKRLTQREVGKSGTSVSGGVIIGEEYSAKLQGRMALAKYDEMRRNDATVNAALDAVKLPILSANFDIDSASEDDADQVVRDFVHTNLFHVIDWDQTLNEILTYLDFGFSLFEMVFEPMEFDGNPRIGLAKLGFRKQTTIERWEMESGQPGVVQAVDGERFSIADYKLVRFTHRQEGDNYDGRSILRSAYKHWYIKDRLYRIDAVGHERQALGVVKIITPTTAKEEDKKKLRKLVQNMRANEKSYIEHPDGYVVEFMDMNAKSMKDTEPSISHHDRQITKNVLAQFLEIGAAGSSGTRSTSEDHSRLFELAVENVAKKIVSTLQNTVVRALVDLNFNDRDYPTLRVGKISDDNIPVLSEAMSKFVTAGVLHPHRGDENTIRKMVSMPQLSDDDLDAIYDVVAPAPKVTEPVNANVVELRKLRASVEKALYEPTDKAA